LQRSCFFPNGKLGVSLFLLSPLLTLHLAAVSIASVGPLLCIWLDWRAARWGDAVAADLGRLLARRSLQFLFLGAALGLVHLAVAVLGADPACIRALAAIETSRWWFAGLELLFSVGCLTVYVVTWDRWRRRWLHRLVALVAATNLLYHFPTLFVLTGVVSQRPDLWSTHIRVRDMLVNPEVLARLAHFLLASLVVACAYLMDIAARRHADPEHAPARLIARLGQVALGAAVLQLPLGLLVLSLIPAPLRRQLLGQDGLATAALALGVVLSLALLHHLAANALGDVDKAATRRSAGLVLLVVLLMVAARCRLRENVNRSLEVSAAATAGRCLVGSLPLPQGPSSDENVRSDHFAG
jgi:hypothetical protein